MLGIVEPEKVLEENRLQNSVEFTTKVEALEDLVLALKDSSGLGQCIHRH